MPLAVTLAIHLALAPGTPPNFVTSVESGHQRRLQSCDLDSRLAEYAPGELAFTVKDTFSTTGQIGVTCYAMGADNSSLAVVQRTETEFQRAMIGINSGQPGATNHLDYPCGAEDPVRQNGWGSLILEVLDLNGGSPYDAGAESITANSGTCALPNDYQFYDGSVHITQRVSASLTIDSYLFRNAAQQAAADLSHTMTIGAMDACKIESMFQFKPTLTAAGGLQARIEVRQHGFGRPSATVPEPGVTETYVNSQMRAVTNVAENKISIYLPTSVVKEANGQGPGGCGTKFSEVSAERQHLVDVSLSLVCAATGATITGGIEWRDRNLHISLTAAQAPASCGTLYWDPLITPYKPQAQRTRYLGGLPPYPPRPPPTPPSPPPAPPPPAPPLPAPPSPWWPMQEGVVYVQPSPPPSPQASLSSLLPPPSLDPTQRSPTSSPPQSPLPLLEVEIEQQFVVDATVDTFDADAFRSNLASAIGVSSQDVSLTVSAGSVVVDALIRLGVTLASTNASSVTSALTALAASPAAATAALGVTVTEVTAPLVYYVEITALRQATPSGPTALAFGVLVPFAWVLPALVLLIVHHRHRVAAAARVSDVVARKPAETATLEALSGAEVAAHYLYARVIGSTMQLGWMLIVVGLTPSLFDLVGVPLAGAGHLTYYFVALPWGLALLLLTLRPIDAKAITFVGPVLVALLLLFALMSLFTAVAYEIDPIARAGNVALFLLCVLGEVLLWPSLIFRSVCRDVPDTYVLAPRLKLKRLWLVLRLFLMGNVIAHLAGFFSPLHFGDSAAPTWRSDDRQTAELAFVASWLVAALTFNPANRGRFLRKLSELLTPRGSEQPALASIKALIGKDGAADTLEKATLHLRALPLARITKFEFEGSAPDHELFNKTVAAAVGEVDAFVTHSWADDGTLKFDKLHEHFEDNLTIWLDKACLDQTDLDASLAYLPVFLQSCKGLVVLLGPTFTKRLWCMIEMFVYVQLGGDRERITVLPLSDEAKTSLQTFRVRHAQCFRPEEKQRLLAVIEAGFGDVQPFDDIIRHILSTTIAEHTIADATTMSQSEALTEGGVDASSLDQHEYGQYTNEDSIFTLLQPDGDDPPAVRLLDGEWLLQRAEAIGAAEGATARSALALPVRQVLEEHEPHAFMDEATLRSLPRGSDVGGAALALICISHAWHGRDHPDPHGDNLLAFVEAVRKQQAHGWKNQQLPTRFAVFYDYCSMPQKRGEAGRTAAEDRAFRRALSQMQVMYAHKKTLVYMLTVNPKWTVTPTWDCKEYIERGWPNFEQRVSMLLKMQSSRAWANVVNVGNPNAKQLVPLTPEGFSALLETLHFTNGADRGPVAELYRKTIENALSQTQELRFVKQGWGDKEIAELVGVLPLCTELRRLALDDNDKITAKGAKTLADAFAERGAAPKLTHLGVEARSSMGLRTNFASSKELRAVCESRRIVIVPFAGIRNDMVRKNQARTNLVAVAKVASPLNRKRSSADSAPEFPSSGGGAGSGAACDVPAPPVVQEGRLKSNSKRLAKERSSSTRMKWRSTSRMVMTGRMVTATSPAVVMPRTLHSRVQSPAR